MAKITKDSGKYEVPVPLLAFTFFFSVCIYILMLGFIFWQDHTDLKPEK